LPFKKTKEKILKALEEDVKKSHWEKLKLLCERCDAELVSKRKEYEIKSLEMENEINKKRFEQDCRDQELDALKKRAEDKRIELESVNKELLDQIRLIEAKSSPSGVWAQAFSMGFSKAWDMMMPIINKGIEKREESISERAIEGVLRGMNNGHKLS